ncbi:hypothetical protein D9611_013895 [Ephemerocybe angulata]|uniref:Uncharacterized protein n=1 Tax=Ephemerocybe angulata TaxID=980116 RepID=A0A8H5B7X3_9AGAR|nr:hypothetical protein D9611_013895 [Tulosesus angulatus]
MCLGDLEKIYAYSLKQCPEGMVPRTAEDITLMTRHLFWRAFSAFGFVIWTRLRIAYRDAHRNFETSNFRYGGLDFLGHKRPKYSSKPLEQLPFFRVNLRERKNWQKKMKNGELQMNGHTYNVYPEPSSSTSPSADLYKHLLNWLDFCETHLLGRPWHPSDHVFPHFGKHIHPETNVSADAISKLITEMAMAANVTGAELFTTHCFRRGGAQYRFMFARVGQRWTLARIRWWGGWALGEKRDTLIRYLLDELYTYEEDHSDALNPAGQDIAASGSHAGEKFEQLPVTAAETRQLFGEFGRHVMRQLESVLESRLLRTPAIAPSPPYHPLCYPPFPAHALVHPKSLTYQPQLSYSNSPVYSQPLGYLPSLDSDPTPHNFWQPPAMPSPTLWQRSICSPPSLNPVLPVPFSDVIYSPNHEFSRTHFLPPPQIERVPSSGSSSTTGRSETALAPPPPQHVVPNLGRSAGSKGWEQVVHDWKFPSPPRLCVALKDWDSAWHKESGQSVLYGQRETIAREFIEVFKENKERFLLAYPEANKNVTSLFKAIQAQQLDSGSRRHRAGKSLF